MSVSPEFSEAVRKRNLLLIRIMLKDSLIYDKTFGKFSEMRDYAEKHNVDFWEKNDNSLIRDEKPWNEKLLDREMTALISHFTKERVLYIKDMIRDIYRLNVIGFQNKSRAQKSSCLNTGSDFVKNESAKPPLLLQDASDNNVLFFKCVIEMNNVILQDNITSTSSKLTKESLKKVKKSAEEIICICNKLLLEEA